MTLHPLAGQPAPASILENIPRLVSSYYALLPDPSNPEQRVAFGTSGHRGSSLRSSFNEMHILAITQAICEFRKLHGTDGPLFLGMDTHALSEPAHISALEVLAANRVEVRVAAGLGYTPTPVVSHAILCHNRGRDSGLADGIVITPSHNPPEDGGFKYNPPNGGPADTATTRWIEARANELLEGENSHVQRVSYSRASSADTTAEYDYLSAYVADLGSVIDLEAIRGAELNLGADPMGGAGAAYWEPIAERYGLKLTVVNPEIDPTFRFMRVDKDGKIRMDCSSPSAMAGLIELGDRYDVAFGNDSDFDRHGIVVPTAGLLNPNHYLAVAVDYLFQNREGWSPQAAVGKTLVSSSMLDRVAARLGRELCEVPVGFKWFVDGLLSGGLGFAGEESAGATLLRRDGTVWTTDKDGFVMDLLAAEITARTGEDPGRHYARLEEEFGSPVYQRVDAPADRNQKKALGALTPEQVEGDQLAGEPILQKLTHAPGNGEAVGGLKVVAASGWFAARPSGTEDVYKIYAESFRGEEHLGRIQDEAQEMVGKVFARGGG